MGAGARLPEEFLNLLSEIVGNLTFQGTRIMEVAMFTCGQALWLLQGGIGWPRRQAVRGGRGGGGERIGRSRAAGERSISRLRASVTTGSLGLSVSNRGRQGFHHNFDAWVPACPNRRCLQSQSVQSRLKVIDR